MNTKKKLKSLVNAAKILSQLPPGEVKDRSIDAFFGKSLAEMDLPDGSFIYKDDVVADFRFRHFIFSSHENGDEDPVGEVVIIIITDPAGVRDPRFTIVCDFYAEPV